MSDQSKQATKDRDWWLTVGAVMGPDVALYGFTDRYSASFHIGGTTLTIPGWLAKRLLELAEAIEEVDDA